MYCNSKRAEACSILALVNTPVFNVRDSQNRCLGCSTWIQRPPCSEFRLTRESRYFDQCANGSSLSVLLPCGSATATDHCQLCTARIRKGGQASSHLRCRAAVICSNIICHVTSKENFDQRIIVYNSNYETPIHDWCSKLSGNTCDKYVDGSQHAGNNGFINHTIEHQVVLYKS